MPKWLRTCWNSSCRVILSLFLSHLEHNSPKISCSNQFEWPWSFGQYVLVNVCGVCSIQVITFTMAINEVVLKEIFRKSGNDQKMCFFTMSYFFSKLHIWEKVAKNWLKSNYFSNFSCMRGTLKIVSLIKKWFKKNLFGQIYSPVEVNS